MLAKLALIHWAERYFILKHVQASRGGNNTNLPMPNKLGFYNVLANVRHTCLSDDFKFGGSFEKHSGSYSNAMK